MKIFLSPSDQVSNTTASGHSERDHCVKIADYAKDYLELNGYTVKIGIEWNRAIESNNWGADLHVPIHTNAGGGTGTLMLCHSVSVNNKYVKAIYEEVAALTPTDDRGIQARDTLYEIRDTNCVCAYLEAEFHDNATTEKWIDDNMENIGKAIARGICKADDKEFKEYESSDTLYKVQAGAFKDEENAKKQVEALQKAGFDAFYYEA